MTTSTAIPGDRTNRNLESASGKAPGAGDGVRSSVRTRAVLIYVAVALLALVPGLLNRLEIGFGGSLLDLPLQALKATLEDIRFGSGLRFWLGITGATMMALLLLYPLRKAFSRKRTLGSVGGWFHVHMILGLGGPVAILYHANFSHGGSNANVALWSMLAVAASGILGYFIYGRASAEFYSVKQQTREQLDAITAILDNLEAMPPAKRQLIAEMASFEAELLTPRQGVFASIAARMTIERRRMRFARALQWLMVQYAREARAAPAEQHRLLSALASHLNAFIRVARHASSRSIREQILARWRLFHLPLFLIMVVAAILHVRAVWNMDPPGTQAVLTSPQLPPAARAFSQPLIGERTARAASTQKSSREVLPAPIAPAPRNNSSAGTKAGAASPSTAAPDHKSIEALLAELDRKSAIAVNVQGQGTAITSTAPHATAPAALPGVRGVATMSSAGNEPSYSDPPKLIEPVAPVRRVDEVPPPARAKAPPPRQPAPTPIAETKPLAVARAPEPPPAASPPQPAPAVRPPAVPAPLPSPAAPPTAVATPPASDMKPIYAELQRKTEDPPMALGAGKRSLTEQLTELEARMAAKKFFHSEAETGFLLSGKHLKLECTQCHSKPLKEERSANPRQCVDCHKQDDVHKGRQPNCASCHTTNRWSQLLKRK